METLREIEKITKALANRRRLAILQHLRSIGASSVGEIAQEIKLSFKATSKHLMVLSSANLVEGEQISLSVLYRLKKPAHKITKSALDSLS